MNKKLTYATLTLTLLMLSFPASVMAVSHENNQTTNSQTTSPTQNKTVYLDTGGKTGHLKYLEQYYIKNESGQLVIDQTRIYYNGYINNSKMYFYLVRPLTKEGTLYPESQIKAIAVLDNVTILNAWYNTQIQQPNSSQELQYPEYFVATIAGILTIIIMVIWKLRKRKT